MFQLRLNNIKWIVVSALALTIASGCNKKESTLSEATKNQILHKGNGTEPQDLDPHIVTGVPEHHLLEALFEGLVAEDPKDLHPVPGVAESWDIAQDGTVYTFHLRKDALWSNGDKVTAQDFVYSWNRALSPTLAGEYAYMLYYVKNAEDFNGGKIKDFNEVGVKALDENTLQVTLRAPTPFYLYTLQHYSTWPVHKATVEKFGKMDERGTKWTRPGNIVSNGPFMLKQWELNKIIVVEKNPKYWDAATVKLNEIHFHPVDSQQTEERMFRAGQLHVTNEVPLNKIAVYKKDQPQDINIHPYLGTYYYRFNTKKDAFKNKLVRKAIAMAIDREAIVENVTKGGQLPAYSFTPPNTSGYTSRTKLKYDIAEAKKLLAEAGYPDGKDFPTAEILYNTSESHKVIAEAVQQMLKKNLNIDVSLVNQDWKVYLDTEKNFNHYMSRAGWIGDYPDPNTFLDLFVTDGGNNRTGWSNAEYDRLIAEAGKTADQNARYEFFQKAEEILMDEMPIVPIYTYTRVYLKSPDVKGWNPTILDHHPYKYVSLGN